MAAEIGCKVGQLPTVYLGLPLGAPNRASSVWDGVEEKMRRKLALWKRNFYPKEGELLSLRARWPAFLCIKCHYSVCLNQWQEDWKSFKGIFCGEDQWGNKAHLIKWEANGFGGLRGLRRSCGKKCLRLSMGKRSLGGEQGRQMGCLGLVCGRNFEGVHLVLGNMVFKVGKGNKVRNVTVEDYWDQNLSQGGWSLRLLRDFNDWELGLVDNINVWVAKVPTKIAFFAWEATWGKVLTLDRLQRRGWHLPNRLASHKYATVANLWGRQGDGGGCWEVHFRRFFQDWELKERGWSMVNRRSPCKDNEESVDHILLHCDKTREFWTLLLTTFGLVWVFPALVRNLLLEWTAKPKNLPRARVFKPKFEGSLYPFIDRVVSVVFGVG
ncbi:hypothetical protein CK203_019452 [Vitis vinifera]|uniref:Reverse transcriptase zinc-binding domain-containing protein n=1 Tax=Vitis vinifera TaxID=29760 RepID=A0A438IZ79_VITVI|nr:hypothetical protein CK203_019452 [Vitis vinifera]